MGDLYAMNRARIKAAIHSRSRHFNSQNNGRSGVVVKYEDGGVLHFEKTSDAPPGGVFEKTSEATEL